MYVGKTKTTFKKRWYHHKYEMRKGTSACKIIQKAWNKYGEENFEFGIIAEGAFNSNELKTLEEIFIKLYGNYNIQKVSRVTNNSLESKKIKSQVMIDCWKTGKRKGVKHHPAWDLYPKIKEYWADKSNGRGGNAHPGKTKIMSKFNIPRGITQLIINKLKYEQDVNIIEGYNKQEIYFYWKSPANSNQAKYKHPGERDIAKTFNISRLEARKLIKEFNTETK